MAWSCYSSPNPSSKNRKWEINKNKNKNKKDIENKLSPPLSSLTLLVVHSTTD